MIKDMERAIFKRETIQLKYLPKVQKKNAEDRSSQGKLSRQVANLKQTLKHTTDNTMQLDTTMEQRRREIQNIGGDISGERDYNENYRNDLKRSQLEMLAKRLEYSNAAFQNIKEATMGQKFGDVAANRFVSNVSEDQARTILENEAQRNAVIEAVVNRLRSEDVMLDRILQPLVEW